MMTKLRQKGESRYLWLQQARQHDAVLALPWWRSPWIGYAIGLVLVFLTTIASRFVKPPHFVWAPFCLAFVFIGYLWGVSPALLTMVLGFLAFTFVVVPQYHLLTINLWYDLALLGPFALAQLVIALLAARHAVQYRRLLVAKQLIDSFVQQLEAQNRQLEQANHRKDLFLIRAAHELRTPLTTILGEAQRVRRSQEKAERTGAPALVGKAPVKAIEARAQELRALLEVLIDLSRFRAEDAPLRSDSCDVGTLCREVVEKQRVVAGRPIAFTCFPEPIILHADCARLSQVVLNLVTHAMQYAQENTLITVSIRGEPSEVVFQVHYEVPALYQAHPEHLSPYTEAVFGEGWGLGLTLSQEIVERHGGRMEVDVSGNNGITCSVHLPRQTG